MIRLRFQGMSAHDSVIVGPADGFRVAGNFLHQLPDQKVLGEYIRHQWRIEHSHFARYDCLEPCHVHFEDVEGTPSQRFGPFRTLHVADGTMYCENKQRPAGAIRYRVR